MNQQLVGQITTIVAVREQHTAKVAELEAELKRTNDMITSIDRVDLPELMREAELSELKLTDGTQVKLGEKVQASISEANRAAAHKWLVDNGFGGIIKTQVAVAFPADQNEAARSLSLELAEAYGNAVEVKDTVHATTLKSFVTEQLEGGRAIPMDLFGVFTFSEVKVKPPKQR